jgi:hypothetical protein
MKNKTYLLIVFLALSITTQAQDLAPNPPLEKASFGIFGGVNLQTINGTDASGEKLSNSLVTRFSVGINEEIPIAQGFYVQVGLKFISKGSKGPIAYTDNTGTRSVTREITMNYFEVPLHLIFKPMLGTGRMILGFGPYVGYCIGGKAKYTGDYELKDANIQFEKTVPENDENNLNYFKPWDMGGNFLVGYELKNGLNLVFQSSLGLININSNTTTKLTNKNTGFGLLLGYRF